MAHGGENDLVRIQPGFFRIGFVDAGGGGGQIKYFDDAAALRAGIPAVAAADIVRRDPSLLVGGACQRNKRILPGDKMLHLHRIAYGVNVGNGRFHPVIDQDAALDSQFQSRFLGKTGIWGNADGQHHHIGMEGLLIFQQHIHAAVSFLEPLHRMSQRQLDTVPAHFIVDERSHIRVKGIHKLFRTLNNGDLHSQLPQILRQLQTNKTAAGQYGRLGVIGSDKFFNAESVLHSAQGEELIKPHTGKPGLCGFRTGREQQLIVAFLEYFPGFQIPNGNGFPVRVDGRDLMANLHGHPEAGEEAFRGLEGQSLGIGDHITNIIRQTAIGVRNISRPLKYHNFRLLI